MKRESREIIKKLETAISKLISSMAMIAVDTDRGVKLKKKNG